MNNLIQRFTDRFRFWGKVKPLTDEEYIFKHIKRRGTCPDCTDGRLIEGPSAGGSTNYYCEKCPSRFNIMIDGTGLHSDFEILSVDRI